MLGGFFRFYILATSKVHSSVPQLHSSTVQIHCSDPHIRSSGPQFRTIVQDHMSIFQIRSSEPHSHRTTVQDHISQDHRSIIQDHSSQDHRSTVQDHFSTVQIHSSDLLLRLDVHALYDNSQSLQQAEAGGSRQAAANPTHVHRPRSCLHMPFVQAA